MSNIIRLDEFKKRKKAKYATITRLDDRLKIEWKPDMSTDRKYTDSMARIRASLERINQLMTELNKDKKEADEK